MYNILAKTPWETKARGVLSHSLFYLPCSNKAPHFQPRKYLVLKTSCPRIGNENASQNKGRKSWDFRGIKKATIFGVHFDRGFEGVFTTICSAVFHPFFVACPVGFRGFRHNKCKGRKRVKKGYQEYQKYSFVLQPSIDKRILVLPLGGICDSERSYKHYEQTRTQQTIEKGL